MFYYLNVKEFGIYRIITQKQKITFGFEFCYHLDEAGGLFVIAPTIKLQLEGEATFNLQKTLPDSQWSPLVLFDHHHCPLLIDPYSVWVTVTIYRDDGRAKLMNFLNLEVSSELSIGSVFEVQFDCWGDDKKV